MVHGGRTTPALDEAIFLDSRVGFGTVGAMAWEHLVVGMTGTALVWMRS